MWYTMLEGQTDGQDMGNNRLWPPDTGVLIMEPQPGMFTDFHKIRIKCSCFDWDSDNLFQTLEKHKAFLGTCIQIT